MKLGFSFFFLLSFTYLCSQSLIDLNKHKGFKEIHIGENVAKYKANIYKIRKDIENYSMMPITEDDVYLYTSSTTKTIFGSEILNIFIVSDVYDNVKRISIVLKKPDNYKVILNFFKNEFGKPYFLTADNNDLVYLWNGDEILLQVKYSNLRNDNLYCTIDYIVSRKKAQKDF
ncbi:hypothetical protein IV494_08110 [Kaistella sp. G5-32]|uniref:Uncharacterized protein n=1 Tax=Kaistella gelatinilytica TaxID=2787636 RepID=A0ABS0FBR4_9FLAO|nr:hypothetical protein [Kaistella gelatinilytica]MBF8457146.1 hypothetical protein [Kaistella gelatinilytica]